MYTVEEPNLADVQTGHFPTGRHTWSVHLYTLNFNEILGVCHLLASLDNPAEGLQSFLSLPPPLFIPIFSFHLLSPPLLPHSTDLETKNEGNEQIINLSVVELHSY